MGGFPVYRGCVFTECQGKLECPKKGEETIVIWNFLW